MSKEFDKKYEPDRPGEEASENARVWSIYRDRSRETDQDIVKGWNGMLDVLLMFAGLFSAVVTAFLLEVQNKLEPNQGEYLMKTFLAVHRNQSIDGSEFDPNQYAAPSSAIWITALWLLSLMISLIVALFASLSKQWLQEYTSTMRASSASHQSWTFRHAFFSRGLDRWHVDAIVGGLPVALHAALFIFFAGLVLFFWGLNRSMAILVLVFTVLPLLLYAGTTVAPFMFPDCPTRTSLLRQVVMFWDFLLRNTGSRALPVSALATDNRLVHGGLKTKCTEHVLTTVMTRFPALPEVKAAVTAMGTLDFQQYTAGSYADIGPFGGLTFHAPTVHDVVRKLLLDLAQDRVDGDSHHSKDVLKAWHFLVGIARSSNGSQPGLNLRIPSDESQDFGRAMVLSCFDDTCQMDDYPSQFTPRLLRYDPWDELAEVPYTEDALPLLLDADDVLRNSATPTADLILIRAHLLAFEARKAMSSIRTTVVNPILRRLMNSLLAEIPVATGGAVLPRPHTLSTTGESCT
ncbi:hypothetical protein BKA62DRAFT_45280 [Auriculariales sp. MPI-PUGE-AT-0066]|nr:hypothetical protein BKA62DRAFT_45280 [Auriculariales sp. MPI-PUGE-AT-0066]